MSEVHALGIKFKVTPKHSIIKISNILTQYLKKNKTKQKSMQKHHDEQNILRIK